MKVLYYSAGFFVVAFMWAHLLWAQDVQTNTLLNSVQDAADEEPVLALSVDPTSRGLGRPLTPDSTTP
ncbi:MAG: hypothetical protein HQL19_08065 [Candidatus Omnitrophica bacterium]|nr:hypothetical protein [Candidatus Omnitrophota bacterium]